MSPIGSPRRRRKSSPRSSPWPGKEADVGRTDVRDRLTAPARRANRRGRVDWSARSSRARWPCWKETAADPASHGRESRKARGDGSWEEQEFVAIEQGAAKRGEAMGAHDRL